MTRKTYIFVMAISMGAFPLVLLVPIGQIIFAVATALIVWANIERAKRTGRALGGWISSGSWLIGGLLAQAFALNYKLNILSGMMLDIAGGGAVILVGLAVFAAILMARVGVGDATAT